MTLGDLVRKTTLLGALFLTACSGRYTIERDEVGRVEIDDHVFEKRKEKGKTGVFYLGVDTGDDMLQWGRPYEPALKKVGNRVIFVDLGDAILSYEQRTHQYKLVPKVRYRSGSLLRSFLRSFSTEDLNGAK